MNLIFIVKSLCIQKKCSKFATELVMIEKSSI